MSAALHEGLLRHVALPPLALALRVRYLGARLQDSAAVVVAEEELAAAERIHARLARQGWWELKGRRQWQRTRSRGRNQRIAITRASRRNISEGREPATTTATNAGSSSFSARCEKFRSDVDQIANRAAALRATLGFLALEPGAPELQLLHRCFDSWRGIGDVVTGMARQGHRLRLTNIEPWTWRATFSHDAMVAAEGFPRRADVASSPSLSLQRAPELGGFRLGGDEHVPGLSPRVWWRSSARRGR
jgi:hypothetical protein